MSKMSKSTFLPLLGSGVAGFFGRFLGSEGRATGINLVLFAILILGLSFLFRLYGFRLNKKYGFRLVSIFYISILFFISFFCYFLCIYLIYWFGLCLSGILSTFLFC